MQKKPKKDEIIDITGDVGDISPNLIIVSKKNIAVMSNGLREKIKELNIKTGESARVTYQNGILLTIERNQHVPQKPDTKMHMDNNSETPLTADVTAETPPKKELTSKNPSVNSEDMGDLERHQADSKNVHMQLTTDTLEKMLDGKTYEEIYDLKELFDKIAKAANIKGTIGMFDKDRLDGAIVANAEITGIGSVLGFGNKYDNSIYEYGTKYEYKITLITPETEEQLHDRQRQEEQNNEYPE